MTRRSVTSEFSPTCGFGPGDARLDSAHTAIYRASRLIATAASWREGACVREILIEVRTALNGALELVAEEITAPQELRTRGIAGELREIAYLLHAVVDRGAWKGAVGRHRRRAERPRDLEAVRRLAIELLEEVRCGGIAA